MTQIALNDTTFSASARAGTLANSPIFDQIARRPGNRGDGAFKTNWDYVQADLLHFLGDFVTSLPSDFYEVFEIAVDLWVAKQRASIEILTLVQE